jgi:hypothetical protein
MPEIRQSILFERFCTDENILNCLKIPNLLRKKIFILPQALRRALSFSFNIYFLYLRTIPGAKELPAIAANPPTMAPTKAVTRINKTDEPPRGMICAIFPERMLSFFKSIHNDKNPHRLQIPRNPERNPRPMFGNKNSATKNETMAMLHQGKNIPAINANAAVSSVANKNLMLIRSW